MSLFPKIIPLRPLLFGMQMCSWGKCKCSPPNPTRHMNFQKASQLTSVHNSTRMIIIKLLENCCLKQYYMTC